jgi:hypothetical protein
VGREVSVAHKTNVEDLRPTIYETNERKSVRRLARWLGGGTTPLQADSRLQYQLSPRRPLAGSREGVTPGLSQRARRKDRLRLDTTATSTSLARGRSPWALFAVALSRNAFAVSGRLLTDAR